MTKPKKCNRLYSGMRANISVDADMSLVQLGCGTVGNVNYVIEANSLLVGEEDESLGDVLSGAWRSGLWAQADVRWNVAVVRGQRRKFDLCNPVQELIEESIRIKLSTRMKVDEHRFWQIPRQFGQVMIRYQGDQEKKCSCTRYSRCSICGSQATAAGGSRVQVQHRWRWAKAERVEGALRSLG